MNKKYFHVSSHGLEKGDIFRNRTDYIQGMNDIAICALNFDIIILAFCLMSNHFHFIIYGLPEECRRFAEEYKRRCAIRMRLLSGEVKGMKEIEVRLDHIDSREYLENAIAYVLRNPLAAGIRMMPYHYAWSSASLYFAPQTEETGERLNDMSERKRFRILKSRIAVPDHYMVNAEGMILPSCYVKTDMVENIYKYPAWLMSALSRKIENDVEVSFGIADQVTVTDQELITQMNELIRLEFGRSSIFQLTMEERIRLCPLLKRNFRAGVKQIARVTRLSPKVVEKVV